MKIVGHPDSGLCRGPAERDSALVGGKGQSLGELASIPGISTLPFFTVTTAAFRRLLHHNGLTGAISQLDSLSEEWILLELLRSHGAHHRDLTSRIEDLSHQLFVAFREASVPPEIRLEIAAQYRGLVSDSRRGPARVAVRSSATAEDLPDASFAGMHDSYLNCSGENQVIDAFRRVCASFVGGHEIGEDGTRTFSPKAVFYRNQQRALVLASLWRESRTSAPEGLLPMTPDEARRLLHVSPVYRHSTVALAVVIQVMCEEPDAAGVIFTVEPRTGAPIVTVEANYGLGESVVGGDSSLDGWKLLRPDGRVFDRRLGVKVSKRVPVPGGGAQTIPVDESLQRRFCLTDGQVSRLATNALRIEAHYREMLRRPALFLDLEFAWLGDEPFFLQARPETVWSNRVQTSGLVMVQEQALDFGTASSRTALYRGGLAASPGVASGELLVCETLEDARQHFQSRPCASTILVTYKTAPEWVPVAMGQAQAFVTELGGYSNHAAVVGRELGKPVLVDARGAVAALRPHNGQTVSLDAGMGVLYLGGLPIVTSERHITICSSRSEAPRRSSVAKYDRVTGEWNLIGKPRHPLRSLQRDLYLKAFRTIEQRYGVSLRIIDLPDDRAEALRAFFEEWPVADAETNARLVRHIRDEREAILARNDIDPELLEMVPEWYRPMVTGLRQGLYRHIFIPYEDLVPLTACLGRDGLAGLEAFASVQDRAITRFIALSDSLTSAPEWHPGISGWMDAYIEMLTCFHLRWNYTAALGAAIEARMIRLGLPAELRPVLLSMLQADGQLITNLWMDERKRLSRIPGAPFTGPEDEQRWVADVRRYAENYRLVDVDDLSAAPSFELALKDLSGVNAMDRGTSVDGMQRVCLPPEVLGDDEIWRLLALLVSTSRVKDDAHHLQPRGQFRMRERLHRMGEALLYRGVLISPGDVFDMPSDDVLLAASALDRERLLGALAAESEGDRHLSIDVHSRRRRHERLRSGWAVSEELCALSQKAAPTSRLGRWLLQLLYQSRCVHSESVMPLVRSQGLTVVPYQEVNRFKSPENGTLVSRHQVALHSGTYNTDGISLSEALTPPRAAQREHDHFRDERVIVLGSSATIEEWDLDGPRARLEAHFGEMIFVERGVFHRISNTSPLPTADCTVKEPYLQLQKGRVPGSSNRADKIRILRPEVSEHSWGRILVHDSGELTAAIALDGRGMPLLDPDGLPLIVRPLRVRTRICVICPGALSGPVGFRPWRSDWQTVRVFPWSCPITEGWDVDRDAERLGGEVMAFDSQGRVMATSGFRGGDVIVFRAHRGRMAAAFAVWNRSDSLGLVVAVVDEQEDPPLWRSL